MNGFVCYCDTCIERAHLALGAAIAPVNNEIVCDLCGAVGATNISPGNHPPLMAEMGGVVPTPKELVSAIQDLVGCRDRELAHKSAESLLCNVLWGLGYGDGVTVFRGMGK